MYYAEDSYMDHFLDNVTRMFGIVNVDEYDIERELHREWFTMCNCLMLFMLGGLSVQGCINHL